MWSKFLTLLNLGVLVSSYFRTTLPCCDEVVGIPQVWHMSLLWYLVLVAVNAAVCKATHVLQVKSSAEVLKYIACGQHPSNLFSHNPAYTSEYGNLGVRECHWEGCWSTRRLWLCTEEVQTCRVPFLTNEHMVTSFAICFFILATQ